MNTAPDNVTHHNDNRVSRLMLQVVYALIPAIAAMVWFFGPGVLFQIALAIITAYACEAGMLLLRQRPLSAFITDGSALVTAVLLGMSIPSIAPWWIIVLGTAFAMIFGKHLYGGLGYNPFNPAMLGYVMLLISFPREMTTWAAPVSLLPEQMTFTQIVNLIFLSPDVSHIDAVSAATPLDTLRTNLNLGMMIDSIRHSSELDRVFGVFAGKGWEWINLLILGGGLWLLFKGVIRWQIPVALLGTLALFATIFYFVDSQRYSSPLFHLFSGAAMLGAFFIATDPVSASTTPRGQLVYGGGIGMLTYIIRTWGGYPDAIAFAVLLMNIAAPTIDYYTRPTVFGAGRSK